MILISLAPWRARAAGVIGGLMAFLAGPSLALPPIWIVRDADSEMVIFGSVHILPADLDWQPPVLSAALAKADDVWFELPIDMATQSRVSELALEKGLVAKGAHLSDKLSVAGRARLVRVSSRAGIRPEQLERFRPWLAEATLSVAALQSQGAWARDGVEQVLSAGLDLKVERRAFETPEQQIDILANGREAEQMASAAEQQNVVAEDVSRQISTISMASEQNADVTARSAHLGGELEATAHALHALVARFDT